MYDLIFITNLPSFYKTNLFNRISKYKNILVVFTHDQSLQRNEDFYEGNREFTFISIANKSIVSKISFILDLCNNKPYKQLILIGWDHLVLWIAAFKSPRIKNSIVVESSILESNTNGFKGLMKKIFCSRISKAYVSGKSQEALIKELGFKGEFIITKGVGIFNIRIQPIYKPVSNVKNFIYVGRLSAEKNLQFLIETFNKLPRLTLNIAGFGPQEMFLKSIAKQNIFFHGAVPNKVIYKLYMQNDVFVLPSSSEPWGMVIEEAFNNGLPVIVSHKVGCAAEIVNESNGIIFNLSNPNGLIEAVIKIQDVEFYNNLRFNISKMDFEKIAERQINCYL